MPLCRSITRGWHEGYQSREGRILSTSFLYGVDFSPRARVCSSMERDTIGQAPDPPVENRNELEPGRAVCNVTRLFYVGCTNDVSMGSQFVTMIVVECAYLCETAKKL